MKISKIRLIFIIFLLMTFLAGIYVILNPESITETFTNGSNMTFEPTGTNVPIMTNGLNGNTISDGIGSKNTGVINASREDPAYSNSEFNEFDPYGQYVGVYTNIDALHDSTKGNTQVNNGFSDNAMDPNWGGVELTNQSINSGKYDDNNIYKPMLFQPKTAFTPINPSLGTPKDVY